VQQGCLSVLRLKSDALVGTPTDLVVILPLNLVVDWTDSTGNSEETGATRLRTGPQTFSVPLNLVHCGLVGWRTLFS